MPEEIDITKHEFVPQHIKLNDEQAEETLKRFNISKKQLPRILKEDPAISRLDTKKGDIIRIIRKSPTTGEAEFYRVVI